MHRTSRGAIDPPSRRPAAVAWVYALNRAGRRGKPGRDVFPTGPSEQISLARATTLAVQRPTHRGNAARLRTACPAGPHCRTTVELRAAGRQLPSTRFTQVPDSFQQVRLVAKFPPPRGPAEGPVPPHPPRRPRRG